MHRSQLTQEDQRRVDHYLSSGVNASERKPFRFWLLLGVIWGLMLLFSGISYLIAWHYGVV